MEDHSGVVILVLLPSKNPADPIEAKTLTLSLEELPNFTKLGSYDGYEGSKDESIEIDGVKTNASHLTVQALRQLRHTDQLRYILAENFQKDAEQIARVQLQVRKPAEYYAFWRDDASCDDLPAKSTAMDRFIILANRYLDTSKFFTPLNTLPDSDEIRLLVLPPSNKAQSNVLYCKFRNITLKEPHPSYQLFQIAGPQEPRNQRGPTYKYDVAINGHICTVSDGMRVGLQAMQNEKGERLIWNSELCFNCRDEQEQNHFERLRSRILRNSMSGGVLLYDRLSAFLPISNKNSGVTLPPVNRQSREIRLLRFLSSGHGDGSEYDIRCKLVVKNLDDMPSYKALSYTWGNDSSWVMHYTTFKPEDDLDAWPIVKNSESYTESINGSQELTAFIMINNFRVRVTKHLSNGLRKLRDHGGSKYFWIDALCIDQCDNVDRSSQVSMMAAIYTSAQEVIAWLGEEVGDSRLLPVMNKLGSDEFNQDEFVAWTEAQSSLVPEITEGHQGIQNSKQSSELTFEVILAALQDKEFGKALDELVDNDWWHRLWVYQEATLPRSLVFFQGSRTIHFERFMGGYRMLRRLILMSLPIEPPILAAPGMGKGVYSKFVGIFSERNRRHHPEWWPSPANDFLFYLEALGSRENSDPRDIVYAALGLSRSAPKSIVPDYSKSIVEVMASAGREIIKRYDDLQILSLCGGVMDIAAPSADYYFNLDMTAEERLEIGPSWIPNWGRHREGVGYKNGRATAMTVPGFCASGNVPAGAKFSKNGRILFGKGVVVGSVKEVLKGYGARSANSSIWAESTEPTKFDAENDLDAELASLTLRKGQWLSRDSWLQTFAKWENAVFNMAPRNSSYVAGGSKSDSFMHVLHTPYFGSMYFGSNIQGHVVDDIPDTAEALVEFDVQADHIKDAEFSNSKTDKDIEASMLARILYKHETESPRQKRDSIHQNRTITDGYELLITENGYLGVSPPGAYEAGGVHIGDLIVVLKGGDVPFVLRQVGTRDRYLLVADACK
jgi:hypothetical protein